MPLDEPRATFEYKSIVSPDAVQLVASLSDAGLAGWEAFSAHPVNIGGVPHWCAVLKREKP